MDTRLYFRIVSIREETAIAKTYELEEIHGRTVPFLPGQFLTFIIQTEKQELRRSYSILSLPDEPIRITIKKVVNGLISRHILQHWHVGEVIPSLPPAGRFTLPPQTTIKRDIFCFAAGSGIVPILPQIRSLVLEEPQSLIHLIYSNRDEDDALFLQAIKDLEKDYANFKVKNFFSDPKFTTSEQGHLSNLIAEALVARELRYKREDAVFLICGPFTYMRMLVFTLGLMHFPKENIRKENYLPEIMRSGDISQPIFPDRNVQIRLHDELHTIFVRSGDSILRSALVQGLNVPYSCEGGVCGVCAARCLEGKVLMSINEVLTNTELKEGWVLTCTGYPAKEETFLEF